MVLHALFSSLFSLKMSGFRGGGRTFSSVAFIIFLLYACPRYLQVAVVALGVGEEEAVIEVASAVVSSY